MNLFLFIMGVILAAAIGVAVLLVGIYHVRMAYIRKKYAIDKVGPALKGMMPKLPKGHHWSIRGRELKQAYGQRLELRVFRMEGLDDPILVEEYSYFLRNDRGHGTWREPAELNQLILRKAEEIAQDLNERLDRSSRAEKLAKLYTD